MPLSDIKEILFHQAGIAVDLEIPLALDHLQERQLQIVTMRAGIGAPILATTNIQNALKELYPGTFDIIHLFSVEIHPVKQSFIVRNFHVNVCFRDVRALAIKSVREPESLDAS